MESIEDNLKRLENYKRPIIGVIGATIPSEGYDPYDSCRLGYELRKIVNQKGAVFTGGVHGVGLDVYEGIIDYCMEKGCEDKFFVLIPNGFEPPEAYRALAARAKGELKIEKFGDDMAERRLYVAAAADYLIVINGGNGTIDEALKGLLCGKPLLCLQNSGGAANVMCRFKEGKVKISLEVNKDLILPFDSVYELSNYLSAVYEGIPK